MKVLLRDTQTGCYYQEASRWTPDKGAAHDFKQTAQAVGQALESRLDHVEILLSYDDPQFDFVLPLPKPHRRADYL